MVGDGKAIVGQLNQALKNRQWFYPKETPWRAAITKKSTENAAAIAPQIADDSAPGGYYRLLRDVAENRPLGDTTTLADPAVVAKLKANYEEEYGS